MFSNHSKKLLKAIGAGDAAAAEKRLQLGAKLEYPGPDKFTPLLLAAQKNHLEIARLLVARGANVNARTSYFDTPLHWAASHDNADFSSFLLESGAEIDARNNDGYTPLMIAALLGASKTAALLLAQGAQRHFVTAKAPPENALQIARRKGHAGVEALLQFGGEADTPQWQRTGEHSVKRLSLIDDATFLTEHFDFASRMYTSIVAGADGRQSHTRSGFNFVARPLVAEARAKCLSLPAPQARQLLLPGPKG
jgi:ankyrin repeat protein